MINKKHYSFKIEKGISIPQMSKVRAGYRSPQYKYPFPIMEIGDSFKVKIEGSKGDTDVKMRVVGNAARGWSAKTRQGKIKFVCRKYPKFIRIWRVA